MDSAVPSLATPQPACCFRSIRSGLQQVRLLRKLMPGKGFYMDVLCYLLKAWKRCAVPAAIASCCHDSICALLASRSPHTVLSCSLFMYILQVSALCHSVLRSAGAFEKSKIQEWPLDGVSDWWVRRRLCKGILRFRGAKCPKFSRVAPRAGAAMRLTAGAARFFVQQSKMRFLNSIG